MADMDITNTGSMHHVNPEYVLCRQIAYYIRAQYPGTIFRFDLAGLNLSVA